MADGKEWLDDWFARKRAEDLRSAAELALLVTNGLVRGEDAVVVAAILDADKTTLEGAVTFVAAWLVEILRAQQEPGAVDVWLADLSRELWEHIGG